MARLVGAFACTDTEYPFLTRSISATMPTMLPVNPLPPGQVYWAIPVGIGVGGVLLTVVAMLVMSKSHGPNGLFMVIPGSAMVNWIATGTACSRVDSVKGDPDRF